MSKMTTTTCTSDFDSFHSKSWICVSIDCPWDGCEEGNQRRKWEGRIVESQNVRKNREEANWKDGKSREATRIEVKSWRRDSTKVSIADPKSKSFSKLSNKDVSASQIHLRMQLILTIEKRRPTTTTLELMVSVVKWSVTTCTVVGSRFWVVVVVFSGTCHLCTFLP